MTTQVQILVDQPRGWMQQEVQMYVEGKNAFPKHTWGVEAEVVIETGGTEGVEDAER